MMEQVDSIPLDTLVSYWISKHGLDWVHDRDVHKTLFDSLVCIRLEDENAVESSEVIVPPLDAHKNGWPQYTTTYRIRREHCADS